MVDTYHQMRICIVYEYRVYDKALIIDNTRNRCVHLLDHSKFDLSCQTWTRLGGKLANVILTQISIGDDCADTLLSILLIIVLFLCFLLRSDRRI